MANSFNRQQSLDELSKQIQITRSHAKAFALIVHSLEKAVAEERRKNFNKHKDNGKSFGEDNEL